MREAIGGVRRFGYLSEIEEPTRRLPFPFRDLRHAVIPENNH
jgi:hypothetical protein